MDLRPGKGFCGRVEESGEGNFDRGRVWKRLLRSEGIRRLRKKRQVKRVFIGVGKKGCPNLPLGQS